jgi:uncharacterized membrane protein
VQIQQIRLQQQNRTVLYTLPVFRRLSHNPQCGPVRWLRLIGIGVFGLQFIGLILWTYREWCRFGVGSDFAVYNQAWSRIGGGNLNPYLSVYAYHYPHYGYPFIRNHFELITWPLSLFHVIFPSSFTLLLIQDVALAGALFATYCWALDVIRKYHPTKWIPQVALAIVVLVGLLIDPFTYVTATEGFHLQPIATLFLVLAAKDIWSARYRRSVVFVVLTLTCGVPVSLYVIGIGLIALLSRDHRRVGLVVVAIGCLWLAVFGSLNLDIGSHVGTNYGYLLGRSNVPDSLSVFALLGGLVVHPSIWLNILRSRWDSIYRFIASSGGIGILSPWGLIPAATVLLPNALNANPGFVSAAGAFQSYPALPFVFIGSLIVGLWLSRSRLGLPAGIAALLIAAIQIIWMATSFLPDAYNVPVLGVGDAKVLTRVLAQIGPSTEVIATSWISGRFSGRQFIYPKQFATQKFPVQSSEVVFVFADDTEAGRYVGQILHAQMLEVGANVDAFKWFPPRGTVSVTVSSGGS